MKRSIFGDPQEPAWDARPEVSVGTASGDLAGTTGTVIQAAMDFVARQGGGTVRLLPGTWRLRNSVFVPTGVRLAGSGEASVLVKEPTVTARLTEDGEDWDQEITVDDPAELRVGDGVRLVARDPFTGGTTIMQRTIIAAAGGRLRLDRRLEGHFYREGDARAATNFALVQCTGGRGSVIEDIALDGARDTNPLLDAGAFDDGCLRLEETVGVVVRRVFVRNFAGDGIVWLVSHDLLVEDCRIQGGARFALHPGSGSQRSVVRRNAARDCAEGIYFCWGAQHGDYLGNAIEDCGLGMSLGHTDTDNLVRGNDLRRSGEAGILFRGETRAFAPHRNRFEGNRITDSGGADGIAIAISGETEGVVLVGNEIRETRGPASRVGIRIDAEVGALTCEGNSVEGVAVPVADLRKG